MDELTMLVQLAGGENEAVSRLRAAGFRRAKDIAGATEDDIRSKGGLSATASHRLVRAAREQLMPSRGSKARSLRRGLAGLPAVGSSGATSGDKPYSSSAGAPRATPPKLRSATSNATDAESLADAAELAARTGRGVSKEESSTLTGQAPSEERFTQSFWRFG